MADLNFNDVPKGSRIPAQIPLNVKEWCKDEATLAYLGVDNNLAFTYHDNIEIFCLAEKTLFRWREVETGEENTGLVPLDFTYPANVIVYDVDYSNKTYNFFPIEYVEASEVITTTATNVGTGSEIFKEVVTVGNTNTLAFKTLTSNTLEFDTSNPNELKIDTPTNTAIPALYVNNAYIPTYRDWVNAGGNLISNPSFIYRGEGTLAKPFTDSVNFTSTVAFTTTPNTSIQNALDGHPTLSYVGTGTRLVPERSGQKIIVQYNNGSYTFSGDFGYSNLDIELNSNTTATISGNLFNMDNATHFNALSDAINVSIGKDYFLTVNGDGFNNSGSNVATFNFAQSRIATLGGEGTIYFPNNNITKYIIDSDSAGSGNNNDGNVTFIIDCKLRADYQGIYKIGGNSRIWVNGYLQSSVSNVTVNPALQAFLHLGGQVRYFEGSTVEMAGERTNGFVFTPTGGFTPSFVGQAPTIISFNNIDNLFNKTTTSDTNFSLIGSNSSTLLDITNIFESPNIWSVAFKNNIFETGTIDNTKVDLTNSNTVSSTNVIDGNVLEHLRTFTSKEAARLAGLPLNSAFIKIATVNAGSFLTGHEYQIAVVGTTNFTLIGASANTVGFYFTATGAGSGTGSAYLITREVLI